jgi:hypothetical protein
VLSSLCSESALSWSTNTASWLGITTVFCATERVLPSRWYVPLSCQAWNPARVDARPLPEPW